jgi:hypothetical protein
MAVDARTAMGARAELSRVVHGGARQARGGDRTPAIQRDLGATLEDLDWTVNAYALSFAVLLMTGAALGGRYRRRRMFPPRSVCSPWPRPRAPWR